MEVSALVNNCLGELVKIRRALHVIPEISEKEFKTAEFVRNYLSGLGFKFKQIGTGTYVDIAGKDRSKTIALRCDIDALPINEKTAVEYKSTNGCMHACGHDGHTAILLVFAGLLKQDRPPCNVRLIFQFGEEGAGGAAQMIDKGVLSGVDEIYALHLDPELEKGNISTIAGAMFAGTLDFEIELEGRASHCAQPQNGVDTVKALSALLPQIYKSNERFKNNSLIHIGELNAGLARNIVSPYAKILLTLRYFDVAAQEEIMMNIAKILVSIDNEYGTNHRLTVGGAYSPLINSPYAVSKISALCEGITECAPRYTGEDFGAYLEKVSGCMVWLGVKDEKHFSPLHSDTFDFNENALLYGLEFFKRIIG